MIHISNVKDLAVDVLFRLCIRKSTVQRYCIMPDNFAVETQYGTVTARKGDALMEGASGQLHALSKEDLLLAYDIDPSEEDVSKALLKKITE